MRLSSSHQEILRVMRAAERQGWAPLSGPDISRVCRRQCRRQFSDWSGPKLRRLEELGIVERLGVTFSGARTWQLTTEGRKAAEGEGICGTEGHKTLTPQDLARTA